MHENTRCHFGDRGGGRVVDAHTWCFSHIYSVLILNKKNLKYLNY